MTDKQVMIDSVDVSKCRYYDDRYGYCDACRDDIDGNSYTKCMYEDNCYYKQLKRKEQECERLKKIIDEAQNSKLDLKSFLVGEAIQKEYEQQLDQLKQTLAEIRDIADKARTDLYTCESIIYADDDLREILQKISEVVND